MPTYHRNPREIGGDVGRLSFGYPGFDVESLPSKTNEYDNRPTTVLICTLDEVNPRASYVKKERLLTIG